MKNRYLLIFLGFLVGIGNIEAAQEDWKANYVEQGINEARNIILDSRGNVYVAGNSESGFVILKYSEDGKRIWVVRYDEGNDNEVSAIDVDCDGNIYIAGNSNGNYVLVKYDENGERLWVRSYSGINDGEDNALAVDVDCGGNIYVAGNSDNNYALLKYSENGKEIWVRRYIGMDSESDNIAALGVDCVGNVYVTGSSGGDYATLKYSQDGDLLWMSRFGRGNNSDDEAAAIVFDCKDESVYVTGTSENDYATVKYDEDGNQIWVAKYNGMSDRQDIAVDIAIDCDGNIYVTGINTGLDLNIRSKRDYATVKYDRNGTEIWKAIYDGQNDGSDEPIAIVADCAGNTYVVGKSQNVGNKWNCTAVKYNTDGDEVWVKTYRDKERELPNGFVVDNNKNIYITGTSYSSGVASGYFIVKYSQADDQSFPAQAPVPALNKWGIMIIIGVLFMSVLKKTHFHAYTNLR